MHLLANLCGLLAVLYVLLDFLPVRGDPCSDCSCKSVQTLDTTLAQEVPNSPFYTPLTTVIPGDKQIDCQCTTFFQLDNKSWVEFTTISYCDGSYLVQKYFVSDTSKNGLLRLQGFLSDSGESSGVYNQYILGSVCQNCTNTTVFLLYSCTLYSDCSLPPEPTSDYLYAISYQPDVPPSCLDKIEALIDKSGLQKGVLERPPHSQHRKCVTRFNGVSCINEDRVPVGDRLAYPPSQSNCAY